MSDRPEDRCALRIQEVYGLGLPEPAGVLHAMSAWRDPEGRLFILRIAPDTPRSATDAFALGLSRARVDAIVTTGQILRDEPALTTDLADPRLVAWRRERLGKSRPPLVVVLSRGQGLDRSHPLFAAAEVCVRSEGLRDALAWLRDERGITSVAVEAGWSTSRLVYQPPLAIDELLLSICQSPELPPGIQGGELLPREAFVRLFRGRSEHHSNEESGPWSFLRLHS